MKHYKKLQDVPDTAKMIEGNIDGYVAYFTHDEKFREFEAKRTEQGRLHRMAINKEATKQAILAFAPIWKQNNMTNRRQELLEIRLEHKKLTPLEKAELAEIREFWDQITAIRAEGNYREVEE